MGFKYNNVVCNFYMRIVSCTCHIIYFIKKCIIIIIYYKIEDVYIVPITIMYNLIINNMFGTV